jgi:hypothetical protein
MAKASRLVGLFLKNFCNVLISKCFCEFFVEKKFELRSEVCDMTGQLAHLAGCLFYNHPHPIPRSPSTTPAHCGTRTQTRTAARHPLGFLQAGRFGSIFLLRFTPGLEAWERASVKAN